MNQMNQMYLFGGLGCIKKFFLMYGGLALAEIGSFRYIGRFLVAFGLISINISIKNSSLDVPNVHG
jgi:hypothetical protein